MLGQSTTLSFTVNNVGGSKHDIGVSQLAVGNVNLVPKPSTSLLVLEAVGMAGFRRRQSK
jgi:hypothetical protein